MGWVIALYKYLEIIQVNACRIIGPGFVCLRMPEPVAVTFARLVRESLVAMQH